MEEVRLIAFNKKFLESIKDYKKIHLNPKEGKFYTIVYNNKRAGIIGFKIKDNNYFLKIGIHQDFRGKGIFKKALELLAKKHNILKIYSTIALANKASIKAHKKVGFKRIPLKQEKLLKKKGLLLKRNIRLVKHFLV